MKLKKDEYMVIKGQLMKKEPYKGFWNHKEFVKVKLIKKKT